MSVSVAGALLADSDYYGTLAAVRDLGRTGVSVLVADTGDRVSRSASSRFCSTRLIAPRNEHTPERLRWLLDTGRAHPGTFLYPTSDDAAWMIARHQDVLRADFLLHQCPSSAVFAVLDKSQLYAHAASHGVPVPTTHAPTSQSEVEDLALTLQRTHGYPVIVKQRTQVGLTVKFKGRVATNAAELLEHVRIVRQDGYYDAAFLQDAPADIDWPLVQQFLPQAQRDTYSVSGYIDATGTVRAARASVKLFQLPVRVGIGIAFEGREVMDRHIQKVEAVAKATGYFGVFEAEFIREAVTAERSCLIDFNPRFYGQMNFDVSRGLRLPRIVYAAAHGNSAEVEALFAYAKTHQRTTDAAAQRFCNRWLFRSLLRAQKTSGKLDAATYDEWLAWMDGAEVFDFVSAADDPAPASTDRKLAIRTWVRHPRAFYREMFT